MINKTMVKYYFKTGLFGLVLFTIFFFWSRTLGFTLNISSNRALANTAFTMIGLCYIIGPLAMKYPWFAKKLYYRKHLGVIGLLIATVHNLYSILIFSFIGVISDFPAWFFSTIALLIFWMLFIITTKPILKKLGPQRWRRIQSWGFYGILFAMVHVFIKSWKSWSWWIRSPFNIPPTSLVVVIFWFVVFFTRYYFYTYRGGKKHPTEK